MALIPTKQKQVTFDDILGKAQTAHSIAIKIPNTQNYKINGEKIIVTLDSVVREKVVDLVSDIFAEKFGGFALNDDIGGWKDNDKIVTERGTFITSYVPELTADVAETLLQLAIDIRDLFRQDAVLVKVDNRAWFI